MNPTKIGAVILLIVVTVGCSKPQPVGEKNDRKPKPTDFIADYYNKPVFANHGFNGWNRASLAFNAVFESRVPSETLQTLELPYEGKEYHVQVIITQDKSLNPFAELTFLTENPTELLHELNLPYPPGNYLIGLTIKELPKKKEADLPLSDPNHPFNKQIDP